MARPDANRVSSRESTWLPVTFVGSWSKDIREEKDKTVGTIILIPLLMLTGEPEYRAQYGDYATS